ncbi:MAG: class I SAM-dependent methyltransferase [Candidatus Altiarchaeota archaeon]|nr:class I SAM-dependent methyltransferase [Candidatus Altiarchaeota archaeon]
MDQRDVEAGIGREYFTNRFQLDILKALLSRTKLRETASILSIGCGEGNELEVLKRYGVVDVLDIDGEAIESIPKGDYCRCIVGDICDFKSVDKYDLIVGLEVLEHIVADAKAVECIADCMKPGGFFVFSVPAHQFLFSSHDRFLNHVRRYSSKGLKSLLSGRFTVAFLSFRYFFLFLPVFLSKLVNRDRDAGVEAPKLPGFLNEFLYLLCRFEAYLFGLGISLPLGISLVGIAKRRT